MRLYKCFEITEYLINSGKIDERHIWCYAQAKIKLKTSNELVQLYGYGTSMR